MDFLNRDDVRFTLDVAASLDAEGLVGLIDEIVSKRTEPTE